MDTALYKDITTLRGLNYHCYVVPTRESKPTLLFLHGFPSTSRDWRHQVSFFREKGYGLIVPDMLGYGGTAKPTNVEAYGANLIAKDIVDILDSEGIQKAILIGHDW
jgi:pimeloyl-ACP methyl ester carboxylesterase